MRALVVDDCMLTREMLAMALEKYASVDRAENGADAVRMATEAMDSETPYNLICMDLNMPEMTGHEALRLIRYQEEHKGTAFRSKAFMITSSSSPDDMMEALLSGDCDDYLTKPVLLKTFAELLNKHGFCGAS